MNRAHLLSVHSRGFDTECRSPAENSARRGLLIVRVLVVLIVFADVNHGQLPQLRQVHYFVERSLPESPFSEEADCHPVRTESFCGESGAGGDADAATNNCVCAKITGCGIGDVHRSAFAAAVACFFSKQFGEHAVRRCAFGEAVSVAAMGAGDVVVDAQSFTNSYCHSFFAAIEVRESRHEGASVDLIHLLFKQPDAHHLAIGMKPLFFFRGGVAASFFSTSLGLGGRHRHIFFPPFVTGVDTPDMAASTSNMHAKSYLVQPMPRAAVRISLLTAVVGKGTSSCRPRSAPQDSGSRRSSWTERDHCRPHESPWDRCRGAGALSCRRFRGVPPPSPTTSLPA